MAQFYGGAGADTYNGTSGEDHIHGAGGADRLSGGAGDDYFVYGSVSDIVAGEQVNGGTGRDIIWLEIEDGWADLSKIAITGVEALAYPGLYDVRMTAAQLAGFTFSLDVESVTLTTGGSVTIANVQGTHDRFNLAPAGNTLDLRNDAWSISMTVNGASGSDTVFGISHNNNELYGEGGGDRLYGGAERDRLYGGDGNDQLSGGDAEDWLSGDAGADTLGGGGGLDHLNGGAGLDKLSGGIGDDELIIDQETDIVAGESYDGGTGTDTLKFGGGGTFDLRGVTLAGLERIDNIYGTVLLNAGQLAAFSQLAGRIQLGSTGTATVLGSNDAWLLLNPGGNTINGSAATGGFGAEGDEGADTITGGAHFDQLSGGGGNDIVRGGAGNDQLRGGAGLDKVQGGAGNDSLYFDAATDYVAGETIEGGDGFDVIRWGYYAFDLDLSGAVLTGIEGIETGGPYSTVSLTAAQLEALTAVGGNFRITTGGTVRMAGVVSAYPDGAPPALNFWLSPSGNTFDMTGFLLPSPNVFGQGGADTVIGSPGDDTIWSWGGRDTLNGGDGNDVLVGGPGADLLNGGAGNDVLMMFSVDDVVWNEVWDGGAGRDILKLDVGSLATVDLTVMDLSRLEGVHAFFATAMVTAAQLDALTALNGHFIVSDPGTIVLAGVVAAGPGLNNFRLADGANVFNMTGSLFGSAQVTGGSGVDTLTGGSQFDWLIGGAGNDILDGGGAGDQLDGNEGDDTFRVNHAGDRVSEAVGQGSDHVLSSVTFSFGGQELEKLTLTGEAAINGTGNDLANILIGNGAANVLNGGAGADTMTGGAGNDTYIVDQAGDQVNESASAGIDRVQSEVSYALASTLENLTLTGSAAIDGTGNSAANILVGNGAANQLSGGAGDDAVEGGAGNDSLLGGDGVDTVGYATATSAVTVSLALATAQATGGAGTDTLSAFENLKGSRFADKLTGNGGANLIDGGAGADTMTGGAGNDLYFVDNVGDKVVEASGGGTDSVQSSATFSLSGNIEKLALTGIAAINGFGNSLANAITGNEAANLLNGGAGVDILTGGGGNDTYIVDNVGDQAIEAAGGGTDTVRSLVTFTLGANFENLVLTGSAVADGTGNALANSLTGNDAANLLNGGGGADTMTGADGDDTYVVDNEGDKVIETNAAGGLDRVRSAIDYVLGANLENLLLTGGAEVDGTGNALANRVTGNLAANRLGGGAGNDIIDGGAGDDFLQGDAGNDQLKGGGGSDRFVFNAALGGANVDTILDYYAPSDTIHLLRTVFTGTGANGLLAAGAFHSGAAAHDASDRIIYNPATGRIFYDADGKGAAAAIHFATVTAGITLTNADFLIYG